MFIFVEVSKDMLITKGTLFDPTQLLAENDYEPLEKDTENER